MPRTCASSCGEPALLLPGDRFIIRMFSPVVTIGGGVVVDTGAKRYRKGDDVKARLETLYAGDAAARIALLVREAPYRHGYGGTGRAHCHESD